jgi:16S rRNA processing protein RimM
MTHVPIGKIGAAHGIKGWLKIHAYTEWQADILNYQPWYLSSDGQHWTKMEQAKGQPHGRSMLVKFPAIETPEAARLLTGKIIGIPRDQLPPLKKDEYYWSELEGLTVINQHGENLGTVRYIMETGAHDVLVVKRDQEKEWAIPYLPNKVIKKVDLIAKEIHIDWEN